MTGLMSKKRNKKATLTSEEVALLALSQSLESGQVRYSNNPRMTDVDEPLILHCSSEANSGFWGCASKIG